MENEAKLTAGAITTFGIAVAALVVLPYIQVRDIQPPEGLKPYTSAELRGREIYVANGCLYCHTQQPRDRSFAPDFDRGWGRVTTPGDYYYDKPHLLGSMRTGPDLMNIGVRQPSMDWHLGHLYQPRAYVPDSTMPSYPYMFEVKDQAEDDEIIVKLPPKFVPSGKVVVARPEAVDLVKYLRSLDRSYPILPPDPQNAGKKDR
ncbi:MULTISPECIES: cbb3-type cytochrome c oxidase subunit II [Nitrosomonas]|uniref:Cytochrome c oxidase cbb3-type subunit 2 n=2 Tax=Nitrosomonas eutropha TaxID=916 RepID=A0ABX5MCM2_9PROT|nr:MULTISPECIES: cbb3-type cytochrome c oxidase subunit II [Nitrosomonas]ABI59827.1 cytochrome C oxidase, mono-heme subunit/FixO [Nitrosomonas eutropha C91]MXS80326.1 cytochrome-c oxidase [Nitrosomonas sp. GH22]PXV83582.1 cytochrome c oxidase cbb3-type subunit 2 [Nitrosomonas eutropha]SCW99815.1 cytochrome c oxidase cbb3-type subunit 2 [Nitrosomonas eutropha]SDW30563.1 cytochrome c oxidase cbb3-type subunit 2 [Nitrosomonas eutropha]